jgi:two-component system chemotaxis response regulator CheY
MRHHAAYGLGFESLDVMIVEDSKVMQSILRSMFNSLKVARLRVFGDGTEALAAMLSEPPNLIVTDWNMKPMSGYRLLKSIRSAGMGPLCRVPSIVVTAHATRSMVDKAMRVGTHHVVVKPFSPAALVARLESILADQRPMVLDEARQTWRIEGVDQLIAANSAKQRALDTARQFHEGIANRAKSVQASVDKILADATIQIELPVPLHEPIGERVRGMGGKPGRPAKAAAEPALPPALAVPPAPAAATPLAAEGLAFTGPRVSEADARPVNPRGFAKVFKQIPPPAQGLDAEAPRQRGRRAA